MFKQFVAILALSLVAGCNQSGDYSGSYVGGDPSALFQLNIVEDANAQVSGGLAISILDPEHDRVKTENIGLKGVRNGSSLSLQPTNGRSGALFFEASGNSLVLKLPTNGQSLELVPTTQQEYQKRLRDFYESMYPNDVGLLPED